MPIRLLPIDDEAYQKLQEMNPGYGRGVIPAGSYPGIDSDVATISDDTILIVPENLPEEHAYWITKTMAENAEKISRIGPALRDFNPKMMPKVMVLDLHPGARRYYEEAGLLP
jgi:TRAP transporter TAXI family solute receptor